MVESGNVLPIMVAAVAGAGAMQAATYVFCSSVSTGMSAAPAPAAQAKPTNGGAGKIVAVLHPGSMGSAIAFNAKLNGARVLWASEGRSPETKARAEADSLEDAATLAAIVEIADFILSVCPPDRALELAKSVAALKFSGTYVDCNAIAPATAVQVGCCLPSELPTCPF